MLTCKAATELVSVKDYRCLSISEKIRLKIHLLTCSACRKFKIQNDFIDEAVHHLSTTDVGNQTLPDECKERIEKHIHPHH